MYRHHCIWKEKIPYTARKRITCPTQKANQFTGAHPLKVVVRVNRTVPANS